MEVFSDERPVDRLPLNIHAVLDHVKAIAKAGFARRIKISEHYDPSLPPVFANRDQLVQVFLNLIKNAAEAIGDRSDGEISADDGLSAGHSPVGRRNARKDFAAVGILRALTTVQASRRSAAASFRTRSSPPRRTGPGPGLALVAKIIGGHGGIVECDSSIAGTTFRVLMPASKGLAGR